MSHRAVRPRLLTSRLLTASEWARRWGVHRNTARARLREIHEKYGEAVVRREGRYGGYRASEESLRAINESAADGLVTREMLDGEMAKVWAVIRQIAGTRGAPCGDF